MNKPALKLLLLSILVSLLLISSCSNSTIQDNGIIGVAVTILPQVEFVERIGGDRVSVTVMVPPGEDPHIYSPSINQMTELSKARIYAKVGSGIDFELAWMERFVSTNPDMVVIDCSQGINLTESNNEEEHLDEDEHDEEIAEEEHHHDVDPHIWTSPLKVMTMVNNIAAGLIEIDPDNRSFYEANRDAYLEELRELDRYVKEGLEDVTRRVFMVYHPSFGYFAADYGLEQLPIEAAGKEPTTQGLRNLIDQAIEFNIKVIFVSPQFNPTSAEVIAEEIGATVITIDPLARDYLDNMKDMAKKLTAAME